MPLNLGCISSFSSLSIEKDFEHNSMSFLFLEVWVKRLTLKLNIFFEYMGVLVSYCGYSEHLFLTKPPEGDFNCFSSKPAAVKLVSLLRHLT